MSNEELRQRVGELEERAQKLEERDQTLEEWAKAIERDREQLRELKGELESTARETEVGIIFVDQELCVQRYGGLAVELFHLREADLARPLFHMNHELQCERLGREIEQVICGSAMHEEEVADADGNSYLLRIRPFWKEQDHVAGAVLSLTSLRLLRESLDKLQKADQMIMELARSILPISWKDEGLAAALEQLAREMERTHGIRCTVSLEFSPGHVDRPHITHLYRIGQEAVQNAVGHGEASHVHLQFFREDGQMVFVVSDNGEGLQTSADKLSAEGTGIRLMKYRCRRKGPSLHRVLRERRARDRLPVPRRRMDGCRRASLAWGVRGPHNRSIT